MPSRTGLFPTDGELPTFDKDYVDQHPEERFFHVGSGRYLPFTPPWLQASPPEPTPLESAQERLERMFESGENSDLTIISGDDRFHVHRFQLSTHSKYFRSLLHGAFKEKDQNEITLHGDDPCALREVLRYLYTFDYTESSTEEADNPILQHLLISITADKYDVEHLPSQALECFRCACENYEDHESGTEQLADTIKELYTNEDLVSFRKIVVHVASDDLVLYRQDRELYQPIWNVIESIPEFAIDLLRGPEMSESLKRPREEEEDDESSGDEIIVQVGAARARKRVRSTLY